MRYARLGCTLVIAGGLGGAWMQCAAWAAEAEATAWWWVGRPSAAVPIPLMTVPEVPPGGLYVAGGPGTPTGISALRWQVDRNAREVVLSLTVHEALGTPVVNACLANRRWNPVEGGAWDQRPAADCTKGEVRGTMSKDSAQLSLDLTSLREDDVVDVVLVPAAGDAGMETFSVSFVPPDEDALRVSSFPSTDEPDSLPSSPNDTEPKVSPAPLLDDIALPSVSVVDAPAGPTNAPQSVLAAPRLTGSSEAPSGFQYPVVLVFPLVVLVLGGYVASALTRPLVMGRTTR